MPSYCKVGTIFLAPVTVFALAASSMSAAISVTERAGRDVSWVPFNHQQFENNIALDGQGQVQLFWTIADTYSTYGIASRSSGYLALGFSDSGAMTGADIALGYRDDSGNFILENRHAGGFVTPQLSKDQTQNIRLREGYQTENATAFVFEKKNSANCLKEQANVRTDSWQWFIYAFSDDNIFEHHKAGNNGKQYIKLGTGKTVSVNEVREIPGAKSFTITQDAITIPANQDIYCYTLHRLPPGKKSFLLGERPPSRSKLLHHLLIYACYSVSDEIESMLGQEPICGIGKFSNPCTGFVTGWAPGMPARTFQPGFGKSFGSDSYEYVMLETHYNNHDGLRDEESSIEYTFLYNNNEVTTEIGTLTLGDLQVGGSTWSLEPSMDLVSHTTVCTPECTKRWPSGGITAISVFHHMHRHGRSARIQVIREGREIDLLSSIHNFEYGYQYSQLLNDIKLLPGDRLITTCDYDTSKDSKSVSGGLTSEHEMCVAFVDYYPANNILLCAQYSLANSSENHYEGTAAVCVEAYKSPDFYTSESLNAPFQHLAVTGNNCHPFPSAGPPEPNPRPILSTSNSGELKSTTLRSIYFLSFVMIGMALMVTSTRRFWKGANLKAIVASCSTCYVGRFRHGLWYRSLPETRSTLVEMQQRRSCDEPDTP